MPASYTVNRMFCIGPRVVEAAGGEGSEFVNVPAASTPKKSPTIKSAEIEMWLSFISYVPKKHARGTAEYGGILS